MESYPTQYVEHNLPLIALSGLGHDSGVSHSPNNPGFTQSPGASIKVDQPELPSSVGQAIRDEFYRYDGSTLAWNSTGNEARPGLVGFKFSNVGRNLVYPRRKAAPAPQATPDESSASPPLSNNAASHDLHSTLSPLSPTSPLFPDGLMTPTWMTKHQSDFPSVLLCFFEINADPSAASLQDNQLKNEITNLKTTLSKPGFRTRLAVVLVTDQSIDEVLAFEERLSTIRRATGLDPKNSFFVLSKPESSSELPKFVLDTLIALQPVCVDYYRDLTKHARRKKNRGYIPPPTGGTARGTSQSLSTHGWNARYDFKQGVFAEFRQEMDVAERHYASAIEELFNPEGVLESTPIWSSRWEEARQLADIIAIRLIRCQLWRSMTSGAAETWTSYKDRTRALVDVRGKGVQTYGYAAWESRWAEIMGQLINRSDVPAFNVSSGPQGAGQEEEDAFIPITIMAPPEKAYATTDRLPPYRLLHHAGYFYRLARRWAVERYQRTQAIPEDDRTPPNETPASRLADRTRAYDTYMVLPPHEELPATAPFNEKISMKVQELDSAARHEFESRRQYRMSARICLDQAKFLASEAKYDEASDVLLPIWHEMSWRREGWWDLAGEVIRDLYGAAQNAERLRLCAELRWEMLSHVFRDTFSNYQPEIKADDTTGTPISLDSQTRLAPVSVSFSFASDEGHVGDTISCQLTLSSRSIKGDLGISISTVSVLLGDGSSRLQLTHGEGDVAGPAQEPKMRDETSSASAKLQMTAAANLGLLPSQTKVYNFTVHLREVGELLVSGIRITAMLGSFTFEYTYSMPTDFNASQWWLAGGKDLIPRGIDRDESYAVHVLPKPPRVQLSLGDSEQQFFTSEEISLKLVVLNEENDSVQGTLRFEVPDDILTAIELQWEDDQDPSNDELSLYQTVDTIESYERREYRLTFKAPAEPINLPIMVAIDYSISDEPTSPVTKATTFNFKIIEPFATEYDLHPRLDNEPWPSFFSLPKSPDESSLSTGIRQKWSISTEITSHSISPLHIQKISLDIVQSNENIHCDVLSDTTPTEPLDPMISVKHHLPLFTRRHSLDDRRPSSLSLALSISWRRNLSSPLVTTTLPIPLLNIPPAEPRVLCTADPVVSAPSSSSADTSESQRSELQNTRRLTYTLENPSMHFLTFTLAMEASDQFAFSGPKMKNVSLTPLSRVSVEYRLMALNTEGTQEWENGPEVEGQQDVDAGAGLEKGSRGKWVYPVLRVTDSYFNKTLRVIDAGEGVKVDDRPAADGGGRGVGVWVPIS
ncbi:hypothetical protein B9Z65_2185 [Elsinoe australis]|uniref:Trafficking protein particle complex subunit 11 n=1 Tax=Elsinoe australis TaxID=40998 RepID=A0A2P7YN97_9PEZI|nr:hypothetical protein B9Z65_2185 [Elsinoe australis]